MMTYISLLSNFDGSLKKPATPDGDDDDDDDVVVTIGDVVGRGVATTMSNVV